MFHIIFTEAPPKLLSFEKDKRADFLSKRVLPKKVPNPVPVLEETSFDLDLMYGSPRISFISSGNPGPSSLTNTSRFKELLFTFISTVLLENFTAFPIKFLRP